MSVPASCRSSCSRPVCTREDKIQGLDAGADDYVTKPFSPKELVGPHSRRLASTCAAPRRRGRGDRYADAESSDTPCPGRWPACRTWSDRIPFTVFFMTHPERVLSRAQLLDEVWGDHVFIEERTVDIHIRRLRATARTLWAPRARGNGARFRLSFQKGMTVAPRTVPCCAVHCPCGVSCLAAW